jgi:hypothetical protein
MKSAYGWLAAGVLALGLNSVYQSAGAQWVHRYAHRVARDTNAVIALATGHADKFLAEARTVSEREQLQIARLEAEHARTQAHVIRVQVPAAAFDSEVHMAQIPACALAHMKLRRTMMISVPSRPAIHLMPVIPEVHIDAGSL